MKAIFVISYKDDFDGKVYFLKEEGDGSKAEVILTSEAWEALGSPEKLRVTIERENDPLPATGSEKGYDEAEAIACFIQEDSADISKRYSSFHEQKM
jgi:hypothetical protein